MQGVGVWHGLLLLFQVLALAIFSPLDVLCDVVIPECWIFSCFFKLNFFAILLQTKNLDNRCYNQKVAAFNLGVSEAVKVLLNIYSRFIVWSDSSYTGHFQANSTFSQHFFFVQLMLLDIAQFSLNAVRYVGRVYQRVLFIYVSCFGFQEKLSTRPTEFCVS